MIFEFLKFFIFSFLIVIISKYALVPLLRKLALTLNLSAKSIGNISGIATSFPEFLTVCFSGAAGLVNTSIFNIISSNVINFIQYIISIFISKNQRIIRNKALKIDLILAILTIIIPLIFINLGVDFIPSIIPIFVLLFILFYYINNNVHKLYLKNEFKKHFDHFEDIKNSTKKIFILRYVFLLILTCISLYVIGSKLTISLENLSDIFHISENILGILLGFITSIPELITFFEAQKHSSKNEDEELGVIEATNNLLTSNILNLFIIQSFGILIFYISN